MNEEQIKEVLSNEEFVKSLMALETPEEVQAALEGKNISLTIDEIKEIAELLRKKYNGELSDENLESVAGGSVAAAVFFGVIVAFAVGTVAGHAASSYIIDGKARWSARFGLLIHAAPEIRFK